MIKRMLYQLKKLFNIKTGEFEDANLFYEEVYLQIKRAKSRAKLRQAAKELVKLDKVTREKYGNPTWMRNRNHTLKMLWILKFNKLKR